MMYVIVHYDPEKLTYVLDHYSHDPGDALTQYDRLRGIYGTRCSLLVDERVLFIHEQRVELLELQPKFAEIRKKYKV